MHLCAPTIDTQELLTSLEEQEQVKARAEAKEERKLARLVPEHTATPVRCVVSSSSNIPVVLSSMLLLLCSRAFASEKCRECFATCDIAASSLPLTGGAVPRDECGTVRREDREIRDGRRRYGPSRRRGGRVCKCCRPEGTAPERHSEEAQPKSTPQREALQETGERLSTHQLCETC